MISAERAPVKPRVIAPRTGDTIPLEAAVGGFIDSGSRGAICLYGDPGSGKTTALRHLAAVLPSAAGVTLLDTPTGKILAATKEHLTIYAAPRPYEIPHLATYRTASWGQDDRIEYLLHTHRKRCKSVMRRVLAADDFGRVGGQPGLWRMALDAMARDDGTTDFRSAVAGFIATQFSDAGWRQLVEIFGLMSLIKPATGPPGSPVDPKWYLQRLHELGSDRRALGLLRHEAVQVLVAAERIIADLRGGASCWYLDRRLKQSLIAAAGRRAAHDGAARIRLERLVNEPKSSRHATAASILNATGTGWIPTRHPTLNLTDATLKRACWPGVELAGVEICRANLHRANLEGAQLDGALLIEAQLTRACLRGASLVRLVASGANLTGADLADASADEAKFDDAWLREADLSGARLRGASFDRADLTRARFTRADCREVDLSHATLMEADFTGANMQAANLSGRRLCDAEFSGASFEFAIMEQCNLEFMTLPEPDFRGAQLEHALLTGSHMPLADFHGASLRSAGLAQIEWEQADLRDVDLSQVSFHLGSSRSGLVFSPDACEGSRTGFYTDEFDEQSFKPPEEIRKANLRGAVLIDALVFDTDFYLVDLRDALYDSEQERHFRRCGAIMDPPD